MGWVAPLVAVANGAMDCGSFESSTARWSHMASGLYIVVYSSDFTVAACHGGMGSLFSGHC